MKKMKTIIIGTSIVGLILTASLAMGENERNEGGERGAGFLSQIFSRKPDVAPVKNAMYKEECGSCHFAYQPGLLPARSWKKILGTLDDHFGENAELDKATQTALTKYLVENAADNTDYVRSKHIMNSLSKNDIPLRITKTPYYIRKHHEIPKRMVLNNPKLGSFSKCSACHVNAEKGSYDEDEVRIPR